MRKLAIYLYSIVLLIFFVCPWKSHAENLEFADALALACAKMESLLTLTPQETSLLNIHSSFFDIIPGKEFWRFYFYYGDEGYYLGSVDIAENDEEIATSFSVQNEEFQKYKEYEKIKCNIRQTVQVWEEQEWTPYIFWTYDKKAEFYDTYGYCGDITFYTQNKKAVLPSETEMPFEAALELARITLITELQVSDKNLDMLLMGAGCYNDPIDGNIWEIVFYRLIPKYRTDTYEFQEYYHVTISAVHWNCLLAERYEYFPDEEYASLPYAYRKGYLYYR